MERIETHISLVDLHPTRVYKRIKPQRLPFVDFSTRQLREAACHNEVVHNAPWAPDVYLGVIEVEGEPAVEMVRLDAAHCLERQVATIGAEHIEAVGARIAAVHAQAERRPAADHPVLVRKRIHDNIDELVAFEHSPNALLERARAAVDARLEQVAVELVERAALGRVLHGDLRAEHVYLRPDGVAILDGVAFNPSLAEGDPADDVAFLVMDLTCNHGRWDLEVPLWEAAGIDASEALRDLYVAHRALIRAKVAFLQRDPVAERRYLLHTLARLEAPRHRPALLAVGGLPGTGKSTLAHQLRRFHGFEVVRSDVVRKQDTTPIDYSDQGRSRVYEQVFEAAGALCAQGRRVIVDASFSKHAWRLGYRELARSSGLPPLLLLCHVPERVALDRLEARVGDPSDADTRVYELAVADWEPVDEEARSWVRWVDTAGRTTETLASATEALYSVGLAEASLGPRPPEGDV